MIRRALLWLLLGISLSAVATDFRPFGYHSRSAIERANTGKPFVMMFWSVDCAYCVDELKQIDALTSAYPGLRLVLVGTDGAQMTKQAGELLARHVPNLRAERWMFDEIDSDRLYFMVDKTWHGELPRAYFYDAAGNVRVVAGQVDPQWLKHWLQLTASRTAD